MWAVIGENLGSLPTRRAAERRTRSNRAKVPRGSPASRYLQASIRLVGQCVDKGESGLASKRTRLLALPCNQIDMMRESELRIKHDTEVADTSRECYAGEERGQPENVNLCKLPAATEPYGLSLRGTEKETVRGLKTCSVKRPFLHS